MDRKITKKDVLTFLGALLAAFITTLVNKISNQREIEHTVKAVLTEERRQIYEASTVGPDQGNVDSSNS